MQKYTGKNLEDVLQTVAHEKGVSTAELTYFVTEEKPGFFGFGAQVTAEVYALSDVKQFIETYLYTFFKDLNIEIEIQIEQEEDSFTVMLNAENNAILIGKERSDAASHEYRCERCRQFGIQTPLSCVGRHQQL